MFVVSKLFCSEHMSWTQESGAIQVCYTCLQKEEKGEGDESDEAE